MQDLLEYNDVYKALFALGAGIILGLERELKDKAAGLKTISVICLGSTLFTILSLKIGNEFTDSGRIASYVISGIGFLGAGVIFKDRVGVVGLTTASVIWISAAIGMAIGFGELYLAGIFLLACLLIIHTARFLNLKIFPSKKSKLLKITLDENNYRYKDELFQKLKPFIKGLEQAKMEQVDGKIVITYEVTILIKNINDVEAFLVNDSQIKSFEF